LESFLSASLESTIEIIKDYNGILILLLLDDPNFKKSLEKVFLANPEKLTHSEFISEGAPHSPSIANWLKDFIKQFGSGMFDNLVMARYMTTSKNIKNLSEEEKQLVKKLLLTYRNLKFFPESMPSDDGEGWEIIPTDKLSMHLTQPLPFSDHGRGEMPTLENKNKVKKENTLSEDKMLSYASTSVSHEIATSNKSIADQNNMSSNNLPKAVEAGGVEPPRSKVAIMDSQPVAPTANLLYHKENNISSIPLLTRRGQGEVEELKKLAAGYPAGSLERMAVEEEVAKLI
jgi:hypothetical protein